MEINNLPIEIFIDILLKIDGKTLGACRRVCKLWKNIIDNSDYLWEKLCYIDFPYSSKIAKENSHSACKWHHVYKNLSKWNHENFMNTLELECKELEFSLQEFINTLSVKRAPLTARNYKRLKFANNNYALVILYNLTLGIVRPVDNTEYKSEKYVQAMGFSLYQDKLYFYYDKEVFVCNLLSPTLNSTCIHQCDFNIKEIKHFDGKTFLFTNCGQIVILSQKSVSVKPINCPPQWRDQIRHICAINDENYIYYSRYLFHIETDKNTHLYSEFKIVTALFFYGENVLIADRNGYIWFYRPREQKFASKPIMEPMTILPNSQYAVHLDVFERKAGPIIIATTLDKVFLMTLDFFPEEKDDELPLTIKRLQMYKRVLENRIILKTKLCGACSIASQ